MHERKGLSLWKVLLNEECPDTSRRLGDYEKNT